MGRLIHIEAQMMTVKDALDKGKNDPQNYLKSTPSEPPLYRPNRRAASFSSSSSLLLSKNERLGTGISRASINSRNGRLRSSRSRLDTSGSRKSRTGSPPWDNSTVISPSVYIQNETRRWGSSPSGLLDRSWISDFEGSDGMTIFDEFGQKKNSNLSATTDQRILDEYPVRKGDRIRRAFTPSIAFLDSQSFRNDVLKYQPNESNYYSNNNNNKSTNIGIMFSSTNNIINSDTHATRNLASKGTVRFGGESTVGLEWPHINAICVGRNGKPILINNTSNHIIIIFFKV